MQFKHIAPIGVMFAFALATPALAQDSGAVDWTGPYIGGSIGYNWQKGDGAEHLRFDTDGDGSFDDQPLLATGPNAGQSAFTPGTCGGAARSSVPAGGCDSDKDAIGWMVHGGYDMQFGSLVAGVVVEAGKAFVRDYVSEYSTTPANYVMTRRIGYNGNLRARLGYTTPGGIMPYVTGGLAYAKVKNSFRTTNLANAFTESNAKEDAWGFTVGGGLEAKVSDNFSIGTRYLWTRYNAKDYNVNVARGAAPAANPFVNSFTAGQTDISRGDKFDVQSIMVTTSFRF